MQYERTEPAEARDTYTERAYSLVRELADKERLLADDTAYLDRGTFTPKDLDELRERAEGYRTFSSYLRDGLEGDITSLMAEAKASRDKKYGSQMGREEIDEAYELMGRIDGGSRTLKLHEWERRDGSKGSRRGYTENALFRSLGYDTFRHEFKEGSFKDALLGRVDGYLEKLDSFELPSGPSPWERAKEYGERFLEWGRGAYERGREAAGKAYRATADWCADALETGKEAAGRSYHAAADWCRDAYEAGKDAVVKAYHATAEGLARGWEATKRGAADLARGIESGIARIGATYKTDSAKRARALLEYNRAMGEAQNAWMLGVLGAKAHMQAGVNGIDAKAGGAVDTFFGWM